MLSEGEQTVVSFLSNVECEREKHLSCGEMLLVKRHSIGVDRLEIVVTTPHTVEMGSHLNSVVTTPWTGCILPEVLESPLDAGIERLRVNLDDTQLE